MKTREGKHKSQGCKIQQREKSIILYYVWGQVGPRLMGDHSMNYLNV